MPLLVNNETFLKPIVILEQQWKGGWMDEFLPAFYPSIEK